MFEEARSKRTRSAFNLSPHAQQGQLNRQRFTAFSRQSRFLTHLQFQSTFETAAHV
jgi:hypothetical protein